MLLNTQIYALFEQSILPLKDGLNSYEKNIKIQDNFTMLLIKEENRIKLNEYQGTYIKYIHI